MIILIKANFSKAELVDKTFILGESQRNYLFSTRIYKARYPERRHPKIRTFENLKTIFIVTGYVAYSRPTRNQRILNEENEFRILSVIIEDPTRKVRVINNLFEVSNTSVRRSLKRNKFHA